MYIVRFGGYQFPADQLEMSETQGVARRGSTAELGGVGGSFDLNGTAPDPLAEDTINKRLILEAASETALQTAIDNLLGEMALSQNDWRQGTRLLLADLPDGTQRASWAKCVEARWTLEYFHQRNFWLGTIDLTFRRSWPVWWTYTELIPLGDHLGDLAATATAGYDLGQGVVEQAVSASPTTFTITNGGKARVMSGIIEIDGAITNPTIYNLTNDHSLAWSGTMAAGDRLTIDIASFRARQNGALGSWADVTLGSDGGQILPMVLEPGANSFRVISTSPSCTLRYYFADAYM